MQQARAAMRPADWEKELPAVSREARFAPLRKLPDVSRLLRPD